MKRVIVVDKSSWFRLRLVVLILATILMMVSFMSYRGYTKLSTDKELLWGFHI